jgi:hypothetical protein
MRNRQSIYLRALVLATIFTVCRSHAQPSATGVSSRSDGSYAITERGLDWRVMSKTTLEHGTNRVHQYVELATGLNYTNRFGQLTESKVLHVKHRHVLVD